MAKTVRYRHLVSATLLLIFSSAPAWAHIDQLVPSATTAGAPTFTLRILGVDLQERILWNGRVIPSTIVSSTEIRATVDASLVAQPGTATVTLEGFNSLTFTINSPLVITTPADLPPAVIGSPYTQPLSRSGGTAAFMWAGAPPAGMSLSPAGVLSGTPATRGLFTFDVRLTDAAPVTATKSFTLFVTDPNCTFSLNAASASFPAAGGFSVPLLRVTAPSGCAWTARSNAGWIAVRSYTDVNGNFASTSSGSGNGGVYYEVATNTGAARTGTLTVAGLTYTVTQAQAQSGCTFSISPSSATVGVDGLFSAGVTVSAPSGCGWTPFSNASWIFASVNTASVPAGNGLANYSVGVNPGATRTGTIDVAGQTFTVTQAGICPPSAYTLSPASRTFDRDGGIGSITVSTAATCGWRKPRSSSWITITNTNPPFTTVTSITGNGQIDFLVPKNLGDWRGGSISVEGQAAAIYQDPDPSACLCPILCLILSPALSPPDTLEVSRTFRDEVLAQTPRGRQYTRMYYQFAAEAIRTMMFDPVLLWRAREMLLKYKPLIESVIVGKNASVSSEDLAEADGFLKSFAAKAGTELSSFLQELRQDLRDPKVHAEFGVTLRGAPARQNPK